MNATTTASISGLRSAPAPEPSRPWCVAAVEALRARTLTDLPLQARYFLAAANPQAVRHRSPFERLGLQAC